jgi:hypothetical protein
VTLEQARPEIGSPSRVSARANRTGFRGEAPPKLDAGSRC